MANLRMVATLRNARNNLIQSTIDAGPAAGTIKIYSGPQPANADTALVIPATHQILGTLTFTDPSAPASSAGVLTFSAITQDVAADNNGTASFARIADSTGATVFDCDVGVSGATINLNTTTIVAGGPIQISSFTITEVGT